MAENYARVGRANAPRGDRTMGMMRSDDGEDVENRMGPQPGIPKTPGHKVQIAEPEGQKRRREMETMKGHKAAQMANQRFDPYASKKGPGAGAGAEMRIEEGGDPDRVLEAF